MAKSMWTLLCTFSLDKGSLHAVANGGALDKSNVVATV